MGAQVLARIWRPKSFEDMVGQEHITRTLMNALRLDRLHHAYLFCGTRGVGKTTIARILAKSFFCQQRKNSEPCNSCPSCKAIDEGNYADLIEVDAASRTKVEDTRDLLSDVQFAPTEGKYKIYLIDEVHMLSGHSFNALLKTLEEPPPHIIFLFATTEPQKLPMTMISRCLRFNLKMITEPVIVARLQEILKAEKISFEEKAIELLARYARGSMRDALSLVDQAIAYCEKDILYDKVASMLGTAQLLTPEEAMDHLIHNRVDELLKATAVMEENGVDFSGFLDNLMALLQDTAVLQLRGSNPQPKTQNSYVKDLSSEEIQLFYQIALLTKKELPWAPSPRRAVDMGLLRMLSMQPLFADEKLIPARSMEEAREEISKEEQAEGLKKEDEEMDKKEEQQEKRMEEQMKEQMEEQMKEQQEELPAAEGKEGTEGIGEQKEEAAEDLMMTQIEETPVEEAKKEKTKKPKQSEKEDKEEKEETMNIKTEEKQEQMEEQMEEQIGEQQEEPAEMKEETKQNTKEEKEKDQETLREEPQARTAKQPSSTNQEQKPNSAQLAAAQGDYTQPHHWAQLVESLDLSGLQASLLGDTRLVDQQKGMWLLRIPAHVRSNLEDKTKEAIEQALAQKLRQSIRLDIEVGAVDDTPSMLRNEKRLQMVRQLNDNPLVKNMVENYDGELDEDSVRQKDASH